MMIEQINYKQFLYSLSMICYLQIGYSQNNESSTLKDNKYEIGLNGGYFVFDHIGFLYETNVGVDFKYFLKHKSKFHYFATTGFTTDIGIKGANLYAINLDAGIQYDILKLGKKPLFVELGAGGLYWLEKFSTQLIEGEIASSYSEFGFLTKLGVGYRILPRLGVQINLTQFSNHGTSAGIGISYSF